MGATLLVTVEGWSWRDWIKDNLGARPLLCADLQDAEHGPPSRVYVYESGSIQDWRLVGGLEIASNPITLIASTVELSKGLSDPVVILPRH